MKYKHSDLQKFADREALKIEDDVLIFDESTTGLEFVNIGLYDKNADEEWKKGGQYIDIEIKGVEFRSEQPKLRYLDLSYQPLQNIVIKNCPRLESLYLYNCNLEEITFEGEFNQLQLIDLSRNKITSLNIEYKNLPKLENLFLSENPIKDITFLSYWILNNEYFDFEIEGCKKIQNPPAETVKQGKEAIIDFFRSEKVDNKELKIILLGNSTAGKTSLVKYMTKREYPPAKTTHGISNTLWKPNDADFLATIWDFGGQEYYHATHRLFLTNNSLYFLLWDYELNKPGKIDTEIYLHSGKETKSVRHFHYEYWLGVIRRKYAKDAEIIAIQNKIDKSGIKTIDQEIKDRYDVAGEYQISIKGAAESEKRFVRVYGFFEEMIKEDILNFIKSRAPEGAEAGKIQRYIDSIRKAIRDSWSEDYISFEEFAERATAVVKKNGDTLTEERLEIATKFLHDTGVLLYYGYGDNILPNSQLKKYVFLNPNYVTSTIYDILDEKTVKPQGGKFDYQHVIDTVGSKEKAELFIQLMKSPNFELIFKYKDHYYASQFLPEKDAVIDWELNKKLNKKHPNLEFAFSLKFPNFFSPSYITRFISRYGSESSDDSYFTRYGILVVINGYIFYVYMNTQEETITVKTTQEGKKERFIRKIYDTFVEFAEGEENIKLCITEGGHFVPIGMIEKLDLTQYNIERLASPLSYEIDISGNHIKVEGNGNVILQDVKGRIININVNNLAEIEEKLSADHALMLDLLKKIYQILKVKEDVFDKAESIMLLLQNREKLDRILQNTEDIKSQLNVHYEKLINLPTNESIKEALIPAIDELLAAQTKAISDDVLMMLGEAFAIHQGDLDEEFNNLKKFYEDLKKTNDVKVKLKLAVPLLGLIGLETEVDLKGWATKMYEKHKWKIFKIWAGL